MVRRKNKQRLIPEQDKRICRSICFCQLTMVLSCVSIVYLSVAIYSPSLKAFKSGFELQPVMCQTVHHHMPKTQCPWASCGEWCLTRTTGFCPQIYSLVRRNGTDIQLHNCTRFANTSCPMVDMNRLNKFNCNNGTACNDLHGVFNCSNGHCKNMSEFFLCHHKADGPTINSAKDNTKLNGFFECHGVHCTKIKKPFSCDRYCSKITTIRINVLIMQENNVITADCVNAMALNEAHGNEHGRRIEATEYWKEDDGHMLTNCASVRRNGDKILGYDCINGTILPQDALPGPFINFTQFWKIYENSIIPVDVEQRFLPNQHNLTIYSKKKLLINLEGCVNTLRGECKEFVTHYGNDGDNNTAQSRYQCYYNKNPFVEVVLARYDLNKTYRQLLISLFVPILLFVLSSISLVVITKSVKVGDDAKMRCIWNSENSDDDANKRKQNKIVNNDHHSSDVKCQSIKSNIHQSNENKVELNCSKYDNPELIGSNKSLLPLSPTNESSTTTTDNLTLTDVPEKFLLKV